MSSVIDMTSREHLLTALAEASELEHNLMCLYLFAAFTLKTSVDEGVSEAELAAIVRWRQQIMGVAVQEMTHLALVANTLTAVGGTAHFSRSAFPIRPGYFPADFVVELAPFDQDTLEHFIFLERPESEPVTDDVQSESRPDYDRPTARGRLVAHIGDYTTVSSLYAAIEAGLAKLTTTLGEHTLFCGPHALQLTPDDVTLPGLQAVTDLATARAALKTIVEQGEGSTKSDGSHFAVFLQIRDEYKRILEANPTFRPARPVVRNPVAFKPAQASDVVWISHPVAACYLDLTNALYGSMLRCLAQIYAMEHRSSGGKKRLLNAAFALMHSLAASASMLTTLPAATADSLGNAGPSFTLGRNNGPYEVSHEVQLITERLEEIEAGLARMLMAPSEGLSKISTFIQMAKSSLNGQLAAD